MLSRNGRFRSGLCRAALAAETKAHHNSPGKKQVAELAARGMVVTKDIDREVWRKAMAPAIEKYLQQFGREKIDAILNAK